MDGRGQIKQVPKPRYKTGFLGSISSVKINGVAVPPRRIYEHSGPAELVLEGENLTPDTLKLYHNGVLYTPLESSDTYAYYLLGDNGTNKVMLNGKNFFTVVVKEIVVPNDIDAYKTICLRNDDIASTNVEGNIDRVNTRENCINYNRMTPEGYRNVLSLTGVEDVPAMEDYGLFNCTQIATATFELSRGLSVAVTDYAKPAYITYQGFIIAVFNYSA